METTNCINLLSGNFEPDEARELLLHLINNEIAFLTLRSFSNEERYGIEDSRYQNQIHSLAQARLDVLEQVLLAGSLECTVRIDSTIRIRLFPAKALS